MALNSQCPKCESTRFETAVEEPSGSAYKIIFVRCSHCGTVVGTTDYYNTGALLEKIAKRMGFDIYR
jgi:uncharacterized Zn finger protein